MLDVWRRIIFRKSAERPIEILPVYVTYDLEQSGRAQPKELVRGAKRVKLDGIVLSWEVGEFKLAWGRDVYGVLILYRRPKKGLTPVQKLIVEVPANAQNVEIRTGSLPEEYRGALREVA